MRVLRVGAARLPVLHAVDAAVIGGSFAGVAAALQFRKSGLRTIVIEPRTYLGREITATLRPWVSLGEGSELWRLLLDHMSIEHTAGEIPLKMDALKLALEDVLLERGVEILYASRPVALLRGAEGVDGVVIANKSGRQVIAAPTVVDATETALLARLAGARLGPLPDTATYERALEFDRVGPLSAHTLPCPRGIGVAASSISFHPGYRGDGHLFVTFEMELPTGQGPGACMQREISARDASMALMAFLFGQVSAFREANLGFASFELCGPQSGCLLGPAGNALAGPIRGLWCLNESARVAEPAIFRDPVGASRLGERVAAELPRRALPRTLTHRAPESELTLATTLEQRESESPRPGRSYERRPVSSSELPVFYEADILVVGGGTSGATAAITAAREGARVVLVEMNPGLGGTGTIGGVHSYWYGRHVGYSARVAALTDAIHETLGHTRSTWNIEAKMYALLREAVEARVAILWNSLTFAALVEQGDRVRGIVAATSWGPMAILADVVIDATGDGDVAAFAGAEFVYGAERDHTTMWYSLAQFTTPGRTRNNFTSSVEISNVEDYTRAILAGRRRGTDVHDHGVYLAPRESRHILSDVVLTHTDQVSMRHWPDVVNVHYSNHDVKGPSTSPWVRMGLIPPNLEIEIPYRALIPRGIDGLILTGKAISATHDALAAIRMQADMENLGGVSALAAVQARRTGVSPRHIDVPALQRRLLEEGILTPDVLSRSGIPHTLAETDLPALVAAIDGSRPLHAYSDMEMGVVFSGRIPMVDVCIAGPDIIPYLEEALAGAQGLRRTHLAQALAFYGSRSSVPILVEEIERCLGADELPARENQIRHANYPPDQGAMPDVVYLLYSLGMARDPRGLPIYERVVDLLGATEADLRDRRKGTFYYVEAIAWAMEQLADARARPILCRLHSFPPLRDQMHQTGLQADFFEERQALLELCIARARARCGDEEGIRTLIGYLDDSRGLLAASAHSHLAAITGQDFGRDADTWRDSIG